MADYLANYRGRGAGLDSSTPLGSYDSMAYILQNDQLDQLTGGYGRRYFQEDGNLGATRLTYNMNYANQQALTRRQKLSSTLAEFGEASDKFNLQYGASLSAREALDTRYMAANEQVSSILGDIDNAPDRASSVSQYSMLAQKSMQDTQRAIASLSGFKAPQSVTAKNTFIDPFSGKEVGFDAKFEDLYQAETDTAGMAKTMVRSEFNQNRDRIKAQVKQDMENNPLYSIVQGRQGVDRLGDQLRNNYRRGSVSREEYERQLVDHALTTGSLYDRRDTSTGGRRLRAEQEGLVRQFALQNNLIDPYDSGSPTLEDVLNSTSTLMKGRDNLDRFASAAALAEMSGAKGFDSFTDDYGKKTYVNPVEYFYNSDINENLRRMEEYTSTKLETARLSDRAAFADEFDNRRNRAMRESDQAAQNAELNRLRTTQIETQKQELQQRLERQKQEYESTISGLSGSGDAADTGFIFTDSRPS